MGVLMLIRHGETAWSRTGQHAGRTDLPLTEAGEHAARGLAPRLAGREFAAVFSIAWSRGLATEIADVVSHPRDHDLRDVVLVGHSGGNLPVPAALLAHIGH